MTSSIRAQPFLNFGMLALDCSWLVHSAAASPPASKQHGSILEPIYSIVCENQPITPRAGIYFIVLYLILNWILIIRVRHFVWGSWIPDSLCILSCNVHTPYGGSRFTRRQSLQTFTQGVNIVPQAWINPDVLRFSLG